MTQYELRIYSTDGNLQHIFTDWRTLETHRKVNDVGDFTLSMGNISSADRALFTLDALVEARRKPEGGNWYTEFGGFHRAFEREFTDLDRNIFSSYGRSYLDLIQRRVVAYRGITAYTLKSAPGETVMKELVEENFGATAVNDPTDATSRVADGVMTGLTIQTDLARGANYCTGEKLINFLNVLEVMQDVAKTSKVDFDVVRTTGANFEFQCYYPTLGTDRRSTVVFSTLFANMAEPNYSVHSSEEVTRVIVLGSGTGTLRNVVPRDSVAVSDSPWNLREACVDARDSSSIVYMMNEGDQELEKRKAEEKLAFQIVQSESLRYGRDYFLGDLVTARFEDVKKEVKIVEATCRMNSEGKEEILLGVEVYTP